jgi:3-phenylpropionate/trans-cinnamate dioxygenase ferredoxin reductase component
MNGGLVIIGSGPAGVSAAEEFRKHDSDAPVRIMTEDHDPPYSRPPLSKEFLRGDTEDVALHSADWFTDRSIEVHRGPVAELDIPDHAIVRDGDRMPYDALVLACGAEPVPLRVPGGERALSLRSLADARRLRDAAAGAQSAVVIGAGFIGCEAAASLAMRGVTVHLVAPETQPQETRLGADAGRRITTLVTATGAHYVGGASVREIDSRSVHLDNGRTIECDLVLAATGVRPRIELASAAGLTLEQSRIVVDEHLHSSADDVYAAGDVALAHNVDAGRRIAVEHWEDAEHQGTVAGARAAGRTASWSGVPGFWTDIGDATLKYHAWGDGYHHSRTVDHGDGFTVWYERDGVLVGVLTHNADDDYDLGGQLIRRKQPAPVPMR